MIKMRLGRFEGDWDEAAAESVGEEAPRRPQGPRLPRRRPQPPSPQLVGEATHESQGAGLRLLAL